MESPHFGDAEIRAELRRLVEREKDQILQSLEESEKNAASNSAMAKAVGDKKIEELREKIAAGRDQTLSMYAKIIEFLDRA